MIDIYVPSTWRRFFAVLIDQAFLSICYFPFFSAFYNVWFSETDVELNLFQLGMMFLIPALYEAVSLMLISATPGKWLLGLKVVPCNDPSADLDYTQCLLRPLTSRLTFFFSWAIYALAFFRYDRTHLSDWVAETRVIQFKPRNTRTRIRWIVGSFFVLSYAYEGMVYASAVLNQINWQTGKADLRELLMSNGMDNMEFDFDLDEEGE
ncbi:RDD family protein [Bdellovibrio sp. SKB1291214]|uniref:RDD family protein n=1 Tax=Bdellovibrio sp. SKB1291214 TaxID=1732569 RepID=UPI000B515987|nr:RDD family protein [Bdellovibrio sp. SKB1291214]UYL07956.1 RDD family protein [Bdellovibrio sp. SKB1291214]